MISFGCTAGVPPSFLNSAIAGDRIVRYDVIADPQRLARPRIQD